MRSIEFLRHAQSATNAGLPSSDPGDIPRTGAGRLAAEAAARYYEGPACSAEIQGILADIFDPESWPVELSRSVRRHGSVNAPISRA